MGVMAAIVAQFKAWRPATEPGSPWTPEPADGTVAIRPVAGARSVPNHVDARFGRFAGVEPVEVSRETRQRRARGKAMPLLGRVAVASLFLDRDGKAWSDAEIARSHAAMVRAGEWVEREAIRLGAAVNIDLADTYFVAEDPVREPDVALAILPEGDGDGLFEADAECKLMTAASRAAARLGFADMADLARQVGGRIGADATIWLVHPRSAGRSFVVPESRTGMRGVNLAICYAREANFPAKLLTSPFPDPATFAHEWLHLFGASDKYGVPLRAFPRRSVTHRDIMRLEWDALSRLRIDPATAAEIGWA